MARRDNNIRRGFGTKSTGFGSGCTWFIGTVQTQHSNRAPAMYKEALPSTAPITPVYQNTIRQHQNDRIEQPGDTQVRKDKAGVSSHNWWYRIRCFTFFSRSFKLSFPEIYGLSPSCPQVPWEVVNNISEKLKIYRVFFLTGTPPKSSKYKKVNLGDALKKKLRDYLGIFPI